MGGWKELHNEKLHNLYFSTNIISVIIKRKFRWAELVSLAREK
jgi:hypothetical protein